MNGCILGRKLRINFLEHHIGLTLKIISMKLLKLEQLQLIKFGHPPNFR